MPATGWQRERAKPGTDAERALALIGVPSDAGAAHRGSAMGPEALRVAGLPQALRSLGYRVRDRGNLAGPINPQRPPERGYRHLAEAAAWCRAVRDAVDEALAAGELPIVMGGDHSVSIGSVAAVAAHCADRGRPLSLLWLDAHADFNTAETSPSGNLHGMSVAALCGTGPRELLALGHARPIIDPRRVVQVGVRSVDALEKRNVVEAQLVVYDMRRVDELGMHAVMAEALERVAAVGGHLHVSFDVDFVDASIAPGVGTAVMGGPGYREAQLCMEMIYDRGLPGSLDIVEVNPAFDDRNRTAELAVELVESLFGEQILARAVTEREPA